MRDESVTIWVGTCRPPVSRCVCPLLRGHVRLRRAGGRSALAVRPGAAACRCTTAAVEPGAAPAQSDTGSCRAATGRPCARRRPREAPHWRVPRADRHLPLHQQRRRYRDEVRIDPLLGRAAGERVGDPSQRRVVPGVTSGGCGLRQRSRAFSRVGRLPGGGLQRHFTGQRCGHEHERRAAPPQRVRRSAISRVMVPVGRAGLLVDDAGQRPTQHVALRRRTLSGGRHQLRCGPDMGPLPAGASGVAPDTGVQLGGVD